MEIKKKKHCFVGKEFVDWVVKNQNMTRKEALELGKKLQHHQILAHVDKNRGFEDSSALYRFQVCESCFNTDEKEFMKAMKKEEEEAEQEYLKMRENSTDGLLMDSRGYSGVSEWMKGDASESSKSEVKNKECGILMSRGADVVKEEEHKAIWEGVVIAASSKIVIVEGNTYFPSDKVNGEYLRMSSHKSECPWKGTASYYDVVVNGKENLNAAWYYPNPNPAAAMIKDHIAFWKGVEVS